MIEEKNIGAARTACRGLSEEQLPASFADKEQTGMGILWNR
jgi:hypothetical protein